MTIKAPAEPKTKAGRLKKFYRDRFVHMADWIEKSEQDKVEQEYAAPEENEHCYFRYQSWLHMVKTHKTVAEVIEHPCGMVGCIGGWATVFQAQALGYTELQQDRSGLVVYKSDASGKIRKMTLADERIAQQYFGLTKDEGDYLFYGGFDYRGTDTPTEDVVKKLRRIAVTGRVMEQEWDHTEFYWPYYHRPWSQEEVVGILPQHDCAKESCYE